MMSMTWSRRALRFGMAVVPMVVWAVAASAGQAQQQNMPGMKMPADLGIVSGTVTKAGDKAPVAGATVLATNTTNGIQLSATTQDDGSFVLPSLPAGTYDVSVQLGGYKPFRQQGVAVAANGTVRMTATLEAGDADTERLALLDRIETLEKRLTDIESSAVLSDPETRVRRVEVYVDKNGIQSDTPTPGAKKEVTYQRERVYRRQTINEKIEEAMASEKDQAVAIGVDATTVAQGAFRTKGDEFLPNKKAYALASADLFFTAKLAQYTTFFTDVVALSGAPPDREIPTLTLLNGYTARLVNQNELNLREVWLRTQFFGQRLSLTAGRLDLTNYFDQNTVSNDETTQFLSDALVNNQMLGLASNGTGFALEYDPKNMFVFRFGLQQSNPDATSLSDSIYSLSEVAAKVTPFSLPEGNYRFWFRANNGDVESKKAFGVSLDQKITPVVSLFGRYGTQDLHFGDTTSWDDKYWSAGVGFNQGAVFNPHDSWGIGYSKMDLASGDKEDLVEGYYNFELTERLRLSFSLQHVIDTPAGDTKFGYLLPGVRLQAAF
jgi:hypothetical protein